MPSRAAENGASSVSPPSSLAFWPQGQCNDSTPKTGQSGRFVLGRSNRPTTELVPTPSSPAPSLRRVPKRDPPARPFSPRTGPGASWTSPPHHAAAPEVDRYALGGSCSSPIKTAGFGDTDSAADRAWTSARSRRRADDRTPDLSASHRPSSPEHTRYRLAVGRVDGGMNEALSSSVASDRSEPTRVHAYWDESVLARCHQAWRVG